MSSLVESESVRIRTEKLNFGLDDVGVVIQAPSPKEYNVGLCNFSGWNKHFKQDTDSSKSLCTWVVDKLTFLKEILRLCFSNCLLLL